MKRLLNQIMRKLIYSVLLLIGVTLISFNSFFPVVDPMMVQT
jgi:hypothetical protein